MFVYIFAVISHKNFWYLNREKGKTMCEYLWKDTEVEEQQEDAS